MHIEGVRSDFVMTMLSRVVHTGTQQNTNPSVSVEQTKDLMLKTLEFAMYMQNSLNLKLVRIAGELYQGQNLDTLA